MKIDICTTPSLLSYSEAILLNLILVILTICLVLLMFFVMLVMMEQVMTMMMMMVEDIPAGNGDLPTALHTINLYILQSVAGSHLFIIIINRQQCKVS